MKFTHRFRVKAPQNKVATFHQLSASMGAITPPPIRVQLRKAPQNLSLGGEMDFTLWFGPFPIHWLASIQDVSESGFIDQQLRGPFAKWVHQHSFMPVSDDRTEVIDQITLRLKPHPIWGPVGLFFWLGLPVLFAYRSWKTRRMLEKKGEP
jgi:hypothetical protein